jgi:hypothetical protein
MVQPSIQVEVGVHGLRECCMTQGAIESCVDISIQGGGGDHFLSVFMMS